MVEFNTAEDTNNNVKTRANYLQDKIKKGINSFLKSILCLIVFSVSLFVYQLFELYFIEDAVERSSLSAWSYNNEEKQKIVNNYNAHCLTPSHVKKNNNDIGKDTSMLIVKMSYKENECIKKYGNAELLNILKISRTKIRIPFLVSFIFSEDDYLR